MEDSNRLVTKYYREYPDLTTATDSYLDEHDHLRMKIKHQGQLIEQLTHRLRKETDKRKSIEDDKYTSFKDLVDIRTNTIKKLEDELEAWEARVSSMQMNYSSLRSDAIKKDYSMERLKEELRLCSQMLEEAVSGNTTLETRLQDMELKRKQAEYEYNQLYQLNNSTKNVSWRSKSATRCEDETDCYTSRSRRSSLTTVPLVKKTTYTVVPLKKKTTTTVRKTSKTSTSRRSSVSGSPYEKILIPYHLHALDLVRVRDVYKESWKCDICHADKHPHSASPGGQDTNYSYHCYLCNYDVCQACVDRMEGAVVTDHFTYFTH